MGKSFVTCHWFWPHSLFLSRGFHREKGVKYYLCHLTSYTHMPHFTVLKVMGPLLMDQDIP